MKEIRLPPLAADAVMLVAAAIWGFGFLLQMLGAKHLGPFSFAGLRFGLAALVLAPVLLRGRPTALEWKAGLVSGLALAAGATLQQWGMGSTSAANGGFITSLYVVIAPILTVLLGRRVRPIVWCAVLIALPGFWLMSFAPDASNPLGSVGRGDAAVLGGAFCWAVHLLLVEHWTRRVHPLRFVFLQFAVVGVVGCVVGGVVERPSLASIEAARWAIVVAAIFPTCVAFALQMIAQRTAPAPHAAIILSLEAVFALLAGAVVLGESLTGRAWIGAGLIFGAMLLAQVRSSASRPDPS
jgi:drug/metabolite transporter (DMT)-like permease